MASCAGAGSAAQSKLIDAQFADGLHERAIILGRSYPMFSARAIDDCNIQHSSSLPSAFRANCSMFDEASLRRLFDDRRVGIRRSGPARNLSRLLAQITGGRDDRSGRTTQNSLGHRAFDFARKSKSRADAPIADVTVNDRCGHSRAHSPIGPSLASLLRNRIWISLCSSIRPTIHKAKKMPMKT